MMQISLSDFGQLILPQQTKPRGFIIFYPPATGEKGVQFKEAQAFANQDFACLIYNPPYRKSESRGIIDTDGEISLWEEARAEYRIMATEIQNQFLCGEDKLACVGKNRGGSVAAFATSSTVGCLIVTGSIPILSSFWVESKHPVAAENRSGAPQSKLIEFKSKMSSFDLIHTIPTKKSKILIQFGTRDPWIEKDQVDIFSNAVLDKCIIQSTNDDHSMNSPDSLTQRMKFALESLQ